MKQPLKSDTDAQLHEERVISVRKHAEIGISSSTRENVPAQDSKPTRILQCAEEQIIDMSVVQQQTAKHIVDLPSRQL